MFMQEHNSINAAVFLLSDALNTSEVKISLGKILEQSVNLSEIHIITTKDYFLHESFCEFQENLSVHIFNEDASFSEDFRKILLESKCDLIAFSNGSVNYDGKYSLERAFLKTVLSGCRLMEIEHSFSGTMRCSTESPFGKLDDYVFSKDALLNSRISLSGLSESKQVQFLAESRAAFGGKYALSKIVNSPDFTIQAEKWAISLGSESFVHAIDLCKGLFEASDRLAVPSLSLAAEILTANLLKVSGKYISPFKNSGDDKSHLLLASLAGTIKAGTDTTDKLKEDIERLLSCPVVSVIVPVYNCAKEIRRCLDSIFLQSYKSLEIICVNDGSKDNSLEILREIELENANCRVLTQENCGQATARNRAISVARGKYLGFVDGDDWIETNMFEKMALELELHPEAQLVKCGMSCDYTYPVAEGERKGLESYFSEPEPAGLHRVGPDRLLTGVVCDKLYRASLIKDHGIKFPEGVKNEDEAFALFCVCCAEQYVLLKDKFYHYIRTASGTMNTQATMVKEGKMPDIFSVCNMMLDFLFREKKYGYIGRIIKTILGAADRFEGSPLADEINHAVCTLLDKSKFHLYIDTIVPDKRAWCRKKASKFIALSYQQPYEFKNLSMWMPTKSKIVEYNVSTAPKVTFVVPVYNAEQFLIPTIESLRSQSLEDIEILCINDGSTDSSAEILEQYRISDKRVRVITQENAGVSATRNRGIMEAAGEYIAFVDGDDLVSYNMAEKCLEAAKKYSLEIVAFDYRCFDCVTKKDIEHYWTISNRYGDLPMNQVFGTEAFETRPFSFYGAAWAFLWNTSFLRENSITFPRIKISEDMCFVVYAFSNVKRARILPDVFYHYRRNVPGSAITSLKNNSNSDPRFDTVVEMCRTIEMVEGKNLPVEAKANLIGRLLSEMRYFCNISPKLKAHVESGISSISRTLIPITQFIIDLGLRKWVEETLRKNESESEKVSDVEVKLPKLTAPASFLWSAITEKRQKTKHDLILVIAFLGSKTADPLDSWTFFSWLQEHGIPSKYVISSNSSFYHELVKKRKTANVIALEKSCLQDDHAAYFLRKLFAPLTRAKAVVFEDFVWPWPLRARFKQADWKLVFLQHGVMYYRLSPKMHEFCTRFNLINVSSEAEKKFLESETGCYEKDGYPYPKYVVAGLPRWEKLTSSSDSTQAEKAVFIMFTWREVFENPDYKIKESVYFNSITALIKSPFLEELRSRGIKIVFAPHHHLFDIAPDIINEWPVEFCQQKDISYWVKNASCLITDFSSISWDFRLQNKPVIHWLMDQWDASLGEDMLSQLSTINKRIHQVTSSVRNLSELFERLSYYVDNEFVPTKAETEAFKPFFPYRDGFSQRIYENLCCDNNEEGASE